MRQITKPIYLQVPNLCAYKIAMGQKRKKIVFREML